MYRYIVAATDESVFDYCYEEALEGTRDYIEEGSVHSYDDVVSEVYYQIDTYFMNTHASNVSEKLINEIYEAVMEALQDAGFIDHTNGILTYSGDED